MGNINDFLKKQIRISKYKLYEDWLLIANKDNNHRFLFSYVNFFEGLNAFKKIDHVEFCKNYVAVYFDLQAIKGVKDLEVEVTKLLN